MESAPRGGAKAERGRCSGTLNEGGEGRFRGGKGGGGLGRARERRGALAPRFAGTMTSAEQPNGRRDHPVGEVGEDILAIAAYYERKERLRPRRQSAEKGQGNEQADVEKVVEKPKKRARTGKPGTTLSI